MFISEAMAQAVPATVEAANTATTAPSGLAMITQFALIFAVLYFLLIRPQRKKLQRHEAALSSITKGTKIIIGGIVGTVTKVNDNNELIVRIADNTEITVIRGYISQVIDK